MNKNEISKSFETDFTNPGSIKLGEYLQEKILSRARNIVQKNRPNLIELLKEWLALRSEPKTMLAVRLAKELSLIELLPEIEKLKNDIQTGKCFFPFYINIINDSLASLR